MSQEKREQPEQSKRIVWWQHGRLCVLAVALFLVLALAGCSSEQVAAVFGAAPTATATATATPVPTATATAPPTATRVPTATPPPTATPAPEQVTFAVIGDFGWAGEEEADVASLVKSWQPDFIVTTGDNNYPTGSAESIDENVGQYYHDYLPDGSSSYGPGGERNRFFPVLGNHDTDTDLGQPYFDYFDLPNNERYYTVDWPPVRIYAVNSVAWVETEGVHPDSAQAEWLRQELAASPDTWNIVVFHHPPYGSGWKGESSWMRWPFQEWGADVVINGHNHVYERIMRNGFAYITNGLGGGPRYAWGEKIAEGSEVRYNADNGAQLVEATADRITFQFITRTGEVIDTYTLEK